jgi:hypothetical protein
MKKIDKAILAHEKSIKHLEDLGFIVERWEDGWGMKPPANWPPDTQSGDSDGPDPIISKISIVFLKNGKGRVKFDDHEPFILARSEAQVLCDLVKNDSQDPADIALRDDLVDLKSLETQLLSSARTGGRKCTKRALIQRISRLRGSFLEVGLSDRLIEEQAGSYRLRLTRQLPTLFAEIGPPPIEGGGIGVAGDQSQIH